MDKKEAIFSLIKHVASTFISNYLPISENEDIIDVWKSHCDDLLEANFYGYSTYSEDDGLVAKSVISDRVWYVSIDGELKKEVLDFLNSIFTLDILKAINDAVANVGLNGNRYCLNTDIKIESNGVTLDFSDDEDRVIPYFIKDKSYSPKGIKALHVSVSDSDTPDFQESYDNCVRYNLEFLVDLISCPNTVDLTVVHFQFDSNKNSVSLTVSNKECGKKIQELTSKTLQDKVDSFFSDMHSSIFMW